uniref:Uncharacterized protein n=1 Tax=Amphora coffeiformis TaxID=265554 RepID=A0A7S3KXJ9_9STRA
MADIRTPLLKAEKEAMATAGHLVWSVQDICMEYIEGHFRPPPQDANGYRRIVADKDQSMHDTNELLKRYFEPSLRQLTEFTETILFSILFYKLWAATHDNSSSNDGEGSQTDFPMASSSTHAMMKDRVMPEPLRRVTRAKAIRIVRSLGNLTRLKLEALHHMYTPLERAEQLTRQYVERKGDRVLILGRAPQQQRVELERMECHAVNYVRRQMFTQAMMYKNQANEEMCDTMADLFSESIGNESYYHRLQEWAESAVQTYMMAHQRDAVADDESSSNNNCHNDNKNKSHGDIESTSDTSTANETSTAASTDHEQQPDPADGENCPVVCPLLSSDEYGISMLSEEYSYI